MNSALESIGLTKGEIKVYMALLELGSSSTGKIIKKSNISGSKVYEVLDRLQKKGLVSFLIKNEVKYFEASNPNRILDFLDEKKQKIEDEKKIVSKILPSLISKINTSKPVSAKIFSGWEGIKTANQDIINSLSRGDEWLSMGLSNQPKNWENYFTKKQEERAKKGIILRHMLNKKYGSLYDSRKNLKNTHFRFLPESMQMPMSTEIYKNKVVFFILLKDSPIAIMIENKEVYVSFKKHFELLWKLYN